MSDAGFPVLLDGPGNRIDDPGELLVGYLDWYREALARKTAGLDEERLRAPVVGLGWSPLGLVQHLGWVERRWIRWGFAAEPVAPCPPGDHDAEWRVFSAAAHAPSLGRILFHLLQEYARRVGQLDVARQLIDGTTGE